MSILSAYAKAAVNTALRIQTEIDKIEAGFGRRANTMSDCCELQELANRLYSLLYRRGEVLPEEMDPLTMRFRDLGNETGEQISRETTRSKE